LTCRSPGTGYVGGGAGTPLSVGTSTTTLRYQMRGSTGTWYRLVPLQLSSLSSSAPKTALYAFKIALRLPPRPLFLSRSYALLPDLGSGAMFRISASRSRGPVFCASRLVDSSARHSSQARLRFPSGFQIPRQSLRDASSESRSFSTVTLNHHALTRLGCAPESSSMPYEISRSLNLAVAPRGFPVLPPADV
jgi:hypothetical protein